MFNLLPCIFNKKSLTVNNKDNKDHIVIDKNFENNECIICLEKMIKGEHIKILNCGHIYHEKCINEWYKKVKECPICFK